MSQTAEEQRIQQLETSAMEANIRAARAEYANQFGLTAAEMADAPTDSPESMAMYAELASLRKVQAGGPAAQAVADSSSPWASAVPRADVGGRRSQASKVKVDLEQGYAEAEALGQTPAGRRKLLATIYRDPTKREVRIVRDL